jgi:hypothetical protein
VAAGKKNVAWNSLHKTASCGGEIGGPRLDKQRGLEERRFACPEKKELFEIGGIGGYVFCAENQELASGGTNSESCCVLLSVVVVSAEMKEVWLRGRLSEERCEVLGELAVLICYGRCRLSEGEN